MDGQRFDRLARAVGTGTTRRSVLGMIGAGIASVAAHLSARDASAGCSGEGGDCSKASCCLGLTCVDGTCEAVCAGIGETCGIIAGGELPSIDCCTGFCGESGLCEEFPIVCGALGDSCGQLTGSGDVVFSCCDKGLLCIDGICQFDEPPCIALGESCDFDTEGFFACCDKGAICIDGICQFPETCSALGENCGNLQGVASECCDDLVCIDSTCQTPEPTCSVEGESCGQLTGGLGCCDDLVCVDGICEVIEDTCLDPGGACEVDDDCCTGICCGGTCADIECCIDDANPNDRCPDGTSCFEGICEGVADICESDDDCGTGTCCCDDGSCSGDCCPPDPDDEDEEPVTQLPDTGIGTGGDARTAWWGAAAVGAAAAFLGSKKLKVDNQPDAIKIEE